MRLTKRQLKRIIREEYSRLKRRGLIREMRGSGMKNYGYEEYSSAQLRKMGHSVRDDHAEFDREFVTIGMGEPIQDLQLALEFDPQCDEFDPDEVRYCAAMALKQRGVTTVSDYEQPGSMFRIDDFIAFASSEM